LKPPLPSMKVVEDTYAFAELNEEEGKTTKLK